MTAFATPFLALAATYSAAVSAEAAYIKRESERSWEAFRDAETYGYRGLFADLSELVEACARPDWDGYRAAPINSRSVEKAAHLIRALPLNLAHATLGVEPDGHVTFEWYDGPRRTLSVSVGSEGFLHYAALLGPSRRYGTEPFLGELPTPILNLALEVIGH